MRLPGNEEPCTAVGRLRQDLRLKQNSHFASLVISSRSSRGLSEFDASLSFVQHCLKTACSLHTPTKAGLGGACH